MGSMVDTLDQGPILCDEVKRLEFKHIVRLTSLREAPPNWPEPLSCTAICFSREKATVKSWTVERCSGTVGAGLLLFYLVARIHALVLPQVEL